MALGDPHTYVGVAQCRRSDRGGARREVASPHRTEGTGSPTVCNATYRRPAEGVDDLLPRLRFRIIPSATFDGEAVRKQGFSRSEGNGYVGGVIRLQVVVRNEKVFLTDLQGSCVWGHHATFRNHGVEEGVLWVVCPDVT